MANRYNVTYSVNDGNGKTETIKALVEFCYIADTYGNGYYMGVKAPNEPFGFQGYDIRYDKRFRQDEKIVYITRFFSDRYNGKDGAWSLIGIRIHEMDDDE